ASAVLWTRLAGGNDATALFITVLSLALSWLLTTTWLTATLAREITLDGGKMMLDLAVNLLIPVALGQVARAWRPLHNFATSHKLTLGIVAQGLILVMVLKASALVGTKLAVGTRPLTLLSLAGTIVFILTLHLGILGVGFWSSGWLGCDRPRQIAVAF